MAITKVFWQICAFPVEIFKKIAIYVFNNKQIIIYFWHAPAVIMALIYFKINVYTNVQKATQIIKI